MTHQLMCLDRKLAQEQIGFPLILGGHDHEPFLESINGCTIVKTGMDGKQIAVIELVWDSVESSGPRVSVQLKNATD